MAIVKSVKYKTLTLGAISRLAAKEATESGITPTILVKEGELEGITFPCTVRVRTIEGIRSTNYLYTSRAQTLRLMFSDGTTFAGTLSHKLMTDKNRNVWTTLSDMTVGTEIVTESGVVTVVDIKDNGVQAVADICVPGPHSYLLKNGVVSHNSIVGSTEIAVNMANMGYKVVVMPLEMSKQEMLGRFAAKICGIDANKIITKQLATGEKKLVQEKMDTFMKKVAKKGGRLTIFKPKGDISIEETFAALNALDADVVIIDYISLLSGVDGDDAWQKLGAIARLAKINAEMTNRVNILLCQVNDDGTVRYSRAISEHSSNSWIWSTPLEERNKDVGVIKIKQPKARNSKSFPFEIGIEWRFMRTTDVLSEEQSLPEPKKNLTDI